MQFYLPLGFVFNRVTFICFAGTLQSGYLTIAIAGLHPVGCLPVLITARLEHPLDRTCLEDENADAQSYNQKLVNWLPQLQASLPGSRIVYSNVYTHVIDMVNNPQKYGKTMSFNLSKSVFSREGN
ncbi:hypothetical protein CRYUN_Cryun11dG0153700 [Craigia yunnanensis]